MVLVILVKWGKRFFKGENRSASSPDGSRQPLLPTSTREGSQSSKDSSPENSQVTPAAGNDKIAIFTIPPEVIKDATLGLADGLTVPFALTAGLSAWGDPTIVIWGGLAELIAGGISMGLGGYLGEMTNVTAYDHLLEETQSDIRDKPVETVRDVTKVFEPYQFPPETLQAMVSHMMARENLDLFLMNFHHRKEKPDADRAIKSAATIASAYVIGGLVPLAPYFFASTILEGLVASFIIMGIALFIFGYGKTSAIEGWKGLKDVSPLISGLQMVLVGGTAAGVAMGLVYMFSPAEDQTVYAPPKIL